MAMFNQAKQATQRLPEALSLPPKWLGMYGDFITKNASAVSQIESALRSLTYIIPGMRSDAWSSLRKF
jgi:peroxin-16